jgi:hypothetical protein
MRPAGVLVPRQQRPRSVPAAMVADIYVALAAWQCVFVIAFQRVQTNFERFVINVRGTRKRCIRETIMCRLAGKNAMAVADAVLSQRVKREQRSTNVGEMGAVSRG